LIPQLPGYANDIPSKIIEDVKARCLFTMQVPQKFDYFGKDLETAKDINKEEQEKVGIQVEKMRRKLTNFGKQFKEFPQMQISFYTRAKAMEVCFGSIYKEEANIAASILRSLLKLNVEVRILTCQNIVLSGGSCMVPGFKLRLR
jgi:actin-related protein